MISPVVDGDDADQVVGALEDDWAEAGALADHLRHVAEDAGVAAIDRQVVHLVLGDDDELHQVDGVGPFAQDLALRAALAAVAEEGAHVLEVDRGGVGGERLRRAERLAVAREDVADLALRDGHQRRGVDAVLKRREEVPAAAQHLRLKPRFSLERDEPRLHRAAPRYTLLDDADPRIRDVADEAAQQKQHEQRRRADRDPQGISLQHRRLPRRASGVRQTLTLGVRRGKPLRRSARRHIWGVVHRRSR